MVKTIAYCFFFGFTIACIIYCFTIIQKNEINNAKYIISIYIKNE